MDSFPKTAAPRLPGERQFWASGQPSAKATAAVAFALLLLIFGAMTIERIKNADLESVVVRDSVCAATPAEVSDEKPPDTELYWSIAGGTRVHVVERHSAYLKVESTARTCYLPPSAIR